MDKRRRDRKKRIRKEIFERDLYTCRECGWEPPDLETWDGTSPLTDGVRTLTVDHLVERAAGGSSKKSNLQALCDKCNTKKSVEFGRAVCRLREMGVPLAEARTRAAVDLGIIDNSPVEHEPQSLKSYEAN